MTEQERTRWTKLVADFESSELTRREFATQRGISFSNLRNWIYKLRKESRPLARSRRRCLVKPRAAPTVEGSRLVPVRVVASAAKPRPGEATWPTMEPVLPLPHRCDRRAGATLREHEMAIGLKSPRSTVARDPPLQVKAPPAAAHPPSDTHSLRT